MSFGDTLIHAPRYHSIPSKKYFTALVAATNISLVAAISILGPIQAVLVLTGTALIAVSLTLQAGFPAFLALISQATMIEGMDFGTFRALRWGVTAGLALAVFARLIIERRELGFEFRSVERYFLYYLCWAAFCSLFAIHPIESVAVALGKLPFYGAYFLTIVAISRKADVKLILWILLFNVLASATFSFAWQFTGTFVRIRGFQDNPNGYGAILFLMLPLLYAAISLHRSFAAKLIFRIGIVTGAICILLSGARTSWGAFFIGTIVYLVMEKKKKTLAILAGIPLLLTILLFTYSSVYSLFYDFSRIRAGATHRTTLWDYSLNLVKESPVIGHGLHITFLEVMGNVRGTGSEIGYFLNDMGDIRFHPHNYYLITLVSTGIPGLLIFLFFLWNVFKDQLNNWRIAHAKPDRVFYSAIIAILCGSLFSCFFESGTIMSPGSTANYFWIALGMVEAVRRKNLLVE